MKFFRAALILIALVIIIALCIDFQRVRPVARWGPAAVLIPDGRVLVLGGVGFSHPILSSDSAEARWCQDHLPDSLSHIWHESLLPKNNCQYFDPKTNQWTNGGIIPNLINDAAVLPNGQVIAGCDDMHEGSGWGSTLIISSGYPALDWACVPKQIAKALSDKLNRITAISKGRILVSSPTQSAVYDSATSKWALVDGAPWFGNVIQIDDNRVLSFGGVQYSILDLTTGRWSTHDCPVLTDKLFSYSMALLSNKKILVVGDGTQWLTQGEEQGKCYLFDPAAGKCFPTTMPKNTRVVSSLVVLRSGKVLGIGGVLPGKGMACDLYDPKTDSWRATGTIDSYYGCDSSATLLQDGRVFLFGGLTNLNSLATGEIYDPATEKWTEVSN